MDAGEDPRIQSLAGAAEAAAADSSDNGAMVRTDRERKVVVVSIVAANVAVVPAPGHYVTSNCYLNLEDTDELIRALQAHRADLVKLTGGK